MQNDFINGSLAVNDANEIIPYINSLSNSKRFNTIVRTRDYHPQDHISFASNHNKELFSKILLKDTNIEQIMWPDHCVQGTFGAEYHKDLYLVSAIEILKGTQTSVECYSGFGNAADNTGLATLLKKLGVTDVYVVGLAYDYCVGYTAESAVKEGFNTYVIEDATKFVAQESREKMDQLLDNVGVKKLKIKDIQQ
eukprot:Mrub_11011.p1 GENE.Mrub_11011~~Mrub_11011.p1  ORF type:complete len:209 (+),score=30.12 Mrub_11011:43-627(+)